MVYENQKFYMGSRRGDVTSCGEKRSFSWIQVLLVVLVTCIVGIRVIMSTISGGGNMCTAKHLYKNMK
jgi:hypothetical protein